MVYFCIVPFNIEMIVSGGGFRMPNESFDIPGTLKYSIWQTKTNENQPGTEEKTPELADKPVLESKVTKNRD